MGWHWLALGAFQNSTTPAVPRPSWSGSWTQARCCCSARSLKAAACSDSDLDLVLVFDDLGDYADRQQLEVLAREAIRNATGFASDVRVTDRPEWEVRARQCRSTFEAHIASHAVTLLSRTSRIPVDWDKEIGMAPSDAQQAADSLDNAANALNKLLVMLAPSQHESDALSAGDLATADSMEHSRMLGACEQAQVAMETSLKALIHALEGDHPGKVHHIGELLDMAAVHLSTHAADQIRACLGPISPKHASVWARDRHPTRPKSASKATPTPPHQSSPHKWPERPAT